MSPSDQPKVCAGCGADVTNAQRMKDAQGRYICSACVAKIRARKQGGAGAGGAGGAASVRVGGSSDQGADLREFMVQAKQAAKNQCPSCGVFAQPGSVICLNCGYDARSQSQLQTKFGTARAAKSKGGGGGGANIFSIAMPENGAMLGLIALIHFALVVALPLYDYFVLETNIFIGIAALVVLLTTFTLWIFALIGLMRRVDNLLVSLGILALSFFLPAISAFIALIYSVILARSMAVRVLTIINLAGFLTLFGLLLAAIIPIILEDLKELDETGQVQPPSIQSVSP